MTAAGYVFLLSALFVIFVQFDQYSALKLHITPERFTHEKEKDVTVSCELDSSESTAKEIMALKIAKEGEKAIAIMHPNNSITVRHSAKDRVQASGKIAEPISNSYLRFVIKKPHMFDSGEYSCHIYYMDVEGVLVDDRAADFLIVDDLDKKVLRDNVKKLLDWTKKTDQRIKALKEKGDVAPAIGFSATGDNKLLRPKKGRAMIFPDVIVQQGQGYAKSTGIFTVPQKGIYVFNVLLQTACKVCFIKAQLVANSKVQAALHVSNEEDSRQGSVTAVMELNPGDQVKVYVLDCTKGVYLMFKKYCLFSGFLMKTL